MRRVLPPIKDRQWDVPPYVTSPYGESTGRPRGSSNPHGGVDFNYTGNVAATFNKGHPALRAPVTGVVTNAGQGNYGTKAIRDANGFSHEILHTHARHVAVGDPVVAGQLIGTMGDTGVVGSTPNHCHDHVHYQLKDPSGNRVNPMEYWDQQGPVDPNPAPPAYLGDYQHYLDTPGAVMGDMSASAPNAAPLYAAQAVDPAEAAAAFEARKKMRVLSGRFNPARADLGGFDANAPATVPNQLPSPDRPPSFDERFGNWVASPSVTAPLGPYQPVAPPPQAGRPPGLVTGQPMPDIPLPPQDPTDAPGDEPWSLRRRGPATWPKK